MSGVGRRSPVVTDTLAPISESSLELSDKTKDESHIEPESRGTEKCDAPSVLDHTAVKFSRVKAHQDSPAHGRGILKPNQLSGAGSTYGSHEQRRRLLADQKKSRDRQQSIHQERLEDAKELRSDGDPPPPVTNALFADLAAEETALPLAKRKRVSIDPRPTVDIVTPNSTPSPPPHVPPGLRMVPQRRFFTQDGCPTSRAAQLYKQLSEETVIFSRSRDAG